MHRSRRSAAASSHPRLGDARAQAQRMADRIGQLGAVQGIEVKLLDAVLPQPCNEAPARQTISFFATGMSCGGTITLSRLGTGFEVRASRFG